MDSEDRARPDTSRTSRRSGARGGEPALVRVLAHEHGHPVQALLGRRSGRPGAGDTVAGAV